MSERGPNPGKPEHPHDMPEEWRDDGKCIWKSCKVWRDEQSHPARTERCSGWMKSHDGSDIVECDRLHTDDGYHVEQSPALVALPKCDFCGRDPLVCKKHGETLDAGTGRGRRDPASG